MTKFSTEAVDISADKLGTCHENAAIPGADDALVNSEPGMPGWDPLPCGDLVVIFVLLCLTGLMWTGIRVLWRAFV